MRSDTFFNNVKLTAKCKANSDDIEDIKVEIEARLYKDGDSWFCLVGSNMLSGKYGCGSTPAAAMYNCMEECEMV